MAEPANYDHVREIYCRIEEHPGKCPGFIARSLGLNHSQVMRTLLASEEMGSFVRKDKRGGLWSAHKPTKK